MVPSWQHCGPEEAADPDVNGSQAGRHKPEVDRLKYRPDEGTRLKQHQHVDNVCQALTKDTHKPGPGELVSPLLVDTSPVFTFQDGEAAVEGGEADRSKAGLVHRYLSNVSVGLGSTPPWASLTLIYLCKYMFGRLQREESVGEFEPVKDNEGVAQASIDHKPVDNWLKTTG